MLKEFNEKISNIKQMATSLDESAAGSFNNLINMDNLIVN
jgi:hypothetical protein